MKKDTKQKLTEALVELLLTFLCWAVGVLIVCMFGVDFESDDIDYDLVILLGLVIFFVILVVVSALVEWFKKKFKAKNKKD